MNTLLKAAKSGNIERFQKVLSKRGNIGYEDKQGWTALQHAALRGHTEIARLIIKAWARKLQRNLQAHKKGYDDRVRALYIAAFAGQVDIVKFLDLKNPILPALSPFLRTRTWPCST